MRPQQIAAFAVISGLIASGCAPKAPPPSTPPPPAPPVSVAVSERPLPPIRLAATTTSPQRLELSFRTGGVVQAVLVEEGARVKRGQVLARLDPTELGASVAAAEEGVARAQRSADRARVLAEGRAATRAEAEDAASSVVAATAQLEQARFARARSVITAPVDGRVERRLGDPGEIVGAGQPVLVVSAAGPALYAKALLDDRHLRFVDVGAPASAVVDGAAVVGAVTRIGSVAVAGGQVEIELRFAAPPAGWARELPLGVPLAVDLTTSRSALAVPALAIVDGGRVFVDASKPRPVPVRVLAVDDELVFVVPTEEGAGVTSVLLPGPRPFSSSVGG